MNHVIKKTMVKKKNKKKNVSNSVEKHEACKVVWLFSSLEEEFTKGRWSCFMIIKQVDLLSWKKIWKKKNGRRELHKLKKQQNGWRNKNSFGTARRSWHKIWWVVVRFHHCNTVVYSPFHHCNTVYSLKISWVYSEKSLYQTLVYLS